MSPLDDRRSQGRAGNAPGPELSSPIVVLLPGNASERKPSGGSGLHTVLWGPGLAARGARRHKHLAPGKNTRRPPVFQGRSVTLVSCIPAFLIAHSPSWREANVAFGFAAPSVPVRGIRGVLIGLGFRLMRFGPGGVFGVEGGWQGGGGGWGLPRGGGVGRRQGINFPRGDQVICCRGEGTPLLTDEWVRV